MISKLDPPITDEQRAAAMPWMKLQLGLMGASVLSLFLMLAYLLLSGRGHQVPVVLVLAWMTACDLFITGTSFICSYRVSRIVGDDGRLFQPRRWAWMFIRPFVTIAFCYFVWRVGGGH